MQSRARTSQYNGSLLTEDRVERLVAAQLDELCVSVQTWRTGTRVQGIKPAVRTYYAHHDAARLIKDLVLEWSGAGFMDTSTRDILTLTVMRIGTENVIGSSCAFIQESTGIEKVLRMVEALEHDEFQRAKFVRIDEHSLVYVQPFAIGECVHFKKVYRQDRFCGYG